MPRSVLAALIGLVLHGCATAAPGGPARPSATDLVARFDAEPLFWQQLEIAKQLVALGDRQVLPQLEHWLGLADRHARGNAALVFAGLGDPRGLEVIAAMLSDRSDRPVLGFGAVGGDGRYHLPVQ